MPRHFKVHEVLNSSELEDLRAFAREPARTVDECHQWLLEKRFNVCRTAVGNWLHQYREELVKERFAQSSELARAIKGAVAGGSFGDVADAAVMQLTQVVFEQAAKLQAEEAIDPLDVMRMTRSLKNLVGGKSDLADLIARQQQAVVEAEKTAKAGGSSEAVVAKVRAILGIPDAAPAAGRPT